MKHVIKIIMTGLLILLLFPCFAYSMKVSFFLGKSTVIRNGKTATLNLGDIVGDGDVIKTGKGSMVELLYDDKSKITIKENTVVQIGSLKVKGSSDIAVISGEVMGKYKKLKKGEYKAGTPTTICAVRGTEFKIAVSKGGDSKIELTDGKVDVRNPYGKIELKKGSSAEIDMAEKPVEGESGESLSDWQNEKNDSLKDDIDDQADKYKSHIGNFEEEAEASAAELEGLGESTKNAASKKDLAESGEKIVKSESLIEENMLMTDASKMSIENLMEDYAGKEDDIYSKFKKIAKECNKVQEQQVKNHQALQKIKEDYKKAYDQIMKKFKDDKTKIYKNLEEMKKKSPLNK